MRIHLLRFAQGFIDDLRCRPPASQPLVEVCEFDLHLAGIVARLLLKIDGLLEILLRRRPVLLGLCYNAGSIKKIRQLGAVPQLAGHCDAVIVSLLGFLKAVQGKESVSSDAPRLANALAVADRLTSIASVGLNCVGVGLTQRLFGAAFQQPGARERVPTGLRLGFSAE